MPAFTQQILGCISTLLGTQQQLKLPTNREKPGYPGFSLLAAGFNPAKKFTPNQKYPQANFGYLTDPCRVGILQYYG